MSFILGLHGAVALVLFCSLLFAEEAGVPLPFPGELVLIAGGLLIATGGLQPWVFVPLAYASALSGALVGYSWARFVGERGLSDLADRLHQRRRLERATQRLRQAGPGSIAISRLVPGLRVYTTLVVGAAGINRRTFLRGVAPATLGWVGVFVVIGIVAGVPAVRFLSRVEDLVVQGGLLIVLGVGGYFGIRRMPEAGRAAMRRLPLWLRDVFALLVDLGLIASVVAGVLAVLRPLTAAAAIAGWLDIVIVIAVIAIFYSVATRRGRRPTAGETLFGASYLTQSEEGAVRRSLRAGLWRAVEETSPSSPRLAREAQRFRVLGNQGRLRLVHRLLSGERTAEELASELGEPLTEVAGRLQELQRAGLVRVEADGGSPRYLIRDEYLRRGLAEILGAEEPPP
jgi:membrane protein DedA with SNARE-associated domain/DNA-binding transcriptional ArsR family regulator